MMFFFFLYNGKTTTDKPADEKKADLFKALFPVWTLFEGALATSSSDCIGKRKVIHVASLQQHLGVPRALGILSLRAAPSHPVREQRQPMCQSTVTKE